MENVTENCDKTKKFYVIIFVGGQVDAKFE